MKQSTARRAQDKETTRKNCTTNNGIGTPDCLPLTRLQSVREAANMNEIIAALLAVVYDTDMKKNRWGLWDKCRKALLVAEEMASHTADILSGILQAPNNQERPPIKCTVTLNITEYPDDPKYQLLTLHYRQTTYYTSLEHSMAADEVAHTLRKAADWLLELQASGQRRTTKCPPPQS